MTEPQTVYLDHPPSVNQLYRNVPGLGRVKTKEAQAWITATGWHILTQKVRPVAGHVELSIIITKPDRRKRDLDNLLKASLDALVKHEIIADDSAVQKITIEWLCENKDHGMIIRIIPVAEPDA